MRHIFLAIGLLMALSCTKDSLYHYPPSVLAFATPQDGKVVLRFNLCSNSNFPSFDRWCTLDPNARFNVYSCTPEGVVKDEIAEQLAIDSLVVNGLKNNEVHHFKIQAFLGRTVAAWSEIISVMPGTYQSPEVVFQRSLSSNILQRTYLAPSPDGGKLPFLTLDSTGQWRLMMEDRASGTEVFIINDPVSSILWSPDGQNMLVFNEYNQPNTVWRYERSTGAVTTYTDLPARSFSFLFSNSGQQLCFLKPGTDARTYEVCTMNVDGTNLQSGAYTIQSEFDFDINVHPSDPVKLLYWNPDQKLLYYNNMRVEFGIFSSLKTFRLDIASQQAEEVFVWKSNDLIFNFSPDGRKIAIHSGRSGRYEIWLQDIETGRIQQLTNQTNEQMSFNSNSITWSDNDHFWVYGYALDFIFLNRFEVL